MILTINLVKPKLKKYENYYYIHEYDGKECVQIDFAKYNLDNIYYKIKEILQSNNNTKINEIELFIAAFTPLKTMLES
jgi:NAD-dependent SIR2 family protein deacetylase